MAHTLSREACRRESTGCLTQKCSMWNTNPKKYDATRKGRFAQGKPTRPPAACAVDQATGPAQPQPAEAVACACTPNPETGIRPDGRSLGDCSPDPWLGLAFLQNPLKGFPRKLFILTLRQRTGRLSTVERNKWRGPAPKHSRILRYSFGVGGGRLCRIGG